VNLRAVVIDGHFHQAEVLSDRRTLISATGRLRDLTGRGCSDEQNGGGEQRETRAHICLLPRAIVSQ